jgi:hypothetical protein
MWRNLHHVKTISLTVTDELRPFLEALVSLIRAGQ